MNSWPVGEQLLEVAEAAGHGLAARIDDLGVRQDQVDQADVAEVVRHLVDEERLPCADRRGCRRDSSRRTPQELVRVKLREHRGIARARPHPFRGPQLVHQPRMSASSIVPSTWECEARICSSRVEPARGRPTMKIGSRIRRSRSPGAPRRIRACRLRLARRSCARVRLGVVARSVSLERVAALVVAERFGEFAAILERLAEREAQVIAIDHGAVRGGGLLGAHPRDLVVGEAVGLEVREAPVGIAEVRPGRGGRAVGLDGLLLRPSVL